MDDELVAQFVAVTDASSDKARQYLNISDNDVNQAIELFYNTGGIDLTESTAATPNSSRPSAVPPPQTHPRQESEVINLDSDNGDDEPEIIESRPRAGSSAQEPSQPSGQDDEAMARRLQEELFSGRSGPGELDAEGYRAPIARTTETLVGPGSLDVDDPDEMRSAVMEQMRMRHNRQRGPNGAPGIFNQQASSSIWNEAAESSTEQHQEALARATGGASRTSSKTNMLAEMYRPPFEIMSRRTWENARTEGKENQKWILVNIQDSSIFDCQLLNRDIWKNEGIKETVRENFIFIQYSKDDPRGTPYMRYYFQDSDNQDAYPHIAIVDPRTGEQVKKWSGRPPPKAMDFLMQLHEFLDRYSLQATAKNPVARRKPEPKRERQVERMTEEEQLEMAMQASLANEAGGSDARADPDALTRSIGDVRSSTSDEDAAMIESTSLENDVAAQHPDAPVTSDDQVQGQSQSQGQDPSFSAFASISSSSPHVEPAPGSGITRIQFRHPSGRVVRRFGLVEPVRRLYEWLKAEPLEGKAGTEFQLVAMGKNLMESLEQTIEAAGLMNGTVMVEFIED